MLIKDIVKQIIHIAQIMIKLIAYIDMNNLYGSAISEYLTYGGFKWVENDIEIVNKILNKSNNSLHG